MLCRDVVKRHAKACRVVCCSYRECRGAVSCGRNITNGPDATCTMMRHVEKFEAVGLEMYKDWMKKNLEV